MYRLTEETQVKSLDLALWMCRHQNLVIKKNYVTLGMKSYQNTPIEDYKEYLMFDEKSLLDMHTDDQASGFCLT
jgi:hypothetical protein